MACPTLLLKHEVDQFFGAIPKVSATRRANRTIQKESCHYVTAVLSLRSDMKALTPNVRARVNTRVFTNCGTEGNER